MCRDCARPASVVAFMEAQYRPKPLVRILLHKKVHFASLWRKGGATEVNLSRLISYSGAALSTSVLPFLWRECLDKPQASLRSRLEAMPFTMAVYNTVYNTSNRLLR